MSKMNVKKFVVAGGTNPDICSWSEEVNSNFELTKASALKWAMETCFDDEDGDLYEDGYNVTAGDGGAYFVAPQGYKDLGVVVSLVGE